MPLNWLLGMQGVDEVLIENGSLPVKGAWKGRSKKAFNRTYNSWKNAKEGGNHYLNRQLTDNISIIIIQENLFPCTFESFIQRILNINSGNKSINHVCYRR